MPELELGGIIRGVSSRIDEAFTVYVYFAFSCVVELDVKLIGRVVLFEPVRLHETRSMFAPWAQNKLGQHTSIADVFDCQSVASPTLYNRGRDPSTETIGHVFW